MAYSQKIRGRVRSAYVYKRLSLETIARELGARRQTLLRWKLAARADGDDWDKAKAAASMAGDGAAAVAVKFLEDFVYLLESTMADVKAKEVDMKPQERVDALARLADAYTKATGAVQRSLPKVNELAIAMEVLQLLAKYIAERHPAQQRLFVEILEPFGHLLAKRYG